MTMTMTSWTRGGGRRALLLGLVVAGLLTGLVGMHHLPVAPAPAAPAPVHVHDVAVPDGVPAAPAPHGEDHSELLHLCFAVLAAGSVLLLIALAWRPGVTPPPGRIRRVGVVRSWSRGPPLPVPRRLALLCVLRT